MKLVIEIPAVTYEEVKWWGLYLCPSDSDALVNSIKNGTLYEEKPHGEWIEVDTRFGQNICKCSSCNTLIDVPKSMNENLYSFCPNCGASMRKEGEDDA